MTPRRARRRPAAASSSATATSDLRRARNHHAACGRAGPAAISDEMFDWIGRDAQALKAGACRRLVASCVLLFA
jgi:hypothetical protein